MDLKEYFREIDAGPEIVQEKVRRDACHLAVETAAHVCQADHCHGQWLVFWRRLRPLVACDLAFAAEKAVFGLSEINWGIPPGNLVSKALADTVGHRKALEYIMTGETFTGNKPRRWAWSTRRAAGTASRRDRALASKLTRQEPGRAACSKAWVQALPRTYVGAERGLSLRQAGSGAAPRSGARPRKGTETVPG